MNTTLTRLNTLTDGVFAIVMTLLVFDLTLPRESENLAADLARLLPNFLSYAFSFVILGVYWTAHHRLMEFITQGDHFLLWLNILFLMFVSLIPFSAGLLSHYGATRIALEVYGLNLVMVGLSHLLTLGYAVRGGRLIGQQFSPLSTQAGLLLAGLPVIVYLVAMSIAWVNPLASLFAFVFVPLLYVTGWVYRLLPA